MDSYTPLLERTRVPQPSLQKFAVTSLFSKLRSAPPHLDPNSDPGRHVITQCLTSSSPSVIDQSVRELCRLVSDSILQHSVALLELQSALEGSDPIFVGLFVKTIGFLVRLGFDRNRGSWRFGSHEDHPFLKILLSRVEAQSEVVRQVLIFALESRRWGMNAVCEFLRPLFNFVILRISLSELSLSSCLFAKQLVSSMASFCCSSPNDAMPVLKLLLHCINYLPNKNLDGFNVYDFLECVVDSYIVVLRCLVGVKSHLVVEVQLFGVQLAERFLSILTCRSGKSGGSEHTVEIVKRLLLVQKDLDLKYVPELQAVVLSLFVTFVHSELEHEQLCILKFLNFLLKWKYESVDISKFALSEEVLFTIPVISLMSSTSGSVKGEATDLLVLLEKVLSKLPRTELAIKEEMPFINSPGFIVYRLLRHLWYQDQFVQCSSFFLEFTSTIKNHVDGVLSRESPWSSKLREYSLSLIERRKSSQPLSSFEEIFLTEMPCLLSAIAGVLVIHPSFGSSAIDLLSAVGVMDSKHGIPLLLAILFYSNIFTREDNNYLKILPKLMAMLPSLASHTAMIPLIIQTILPMIQKDVKPVLYATGIRLLCQTWAVNDRAFGSLQAVLLPTGFTEFKSERNISVSLAASIRDVCRQNADRGVDLILSVSACIESQDPIIQTLGFQSLAHLCEADVIDFYTAWDVIAKHALNYSTDPVLARSICLLLRWGAMDAKAYPEASRDVLNFLWHVFTATNLGQTWSKARASAIEALTQYEVFHLEEGIPDLKRKIIDVILFETNFEVLRAMEGFQMKIIIYEHMNRRRFVKEKKVAVNKIEKLLNVFPQVLFTSGKGNNAGQLPGAALLCLSFTPKIVNSRGISRASQEINARYRSALEEIAASLQLSRNTFLAILSLQSWKSFMQRWMRAIILSNDPQGPSSALEKMSRTANDILKSMVQLAEKCVPRSAENIALAIGALCGVLPASVHNVKSTASKFLLNWLFQYEHEHQQWSSAISLGFISSVLHVTDHKQKFQIITGLTEVLRGSKSILVKGGCAIGLGLSCQDLLNRLEVADDNNLEKVNYKMQEVELLGTIVGTLLLMTSQLSKESSSVLESLSAYLPLGSAKLDTHPISEFFLEKHDDLEEDVWGVAGLVYGLGSSVSAIYRAGAHDTVLKIKDLILSWVPHVDSLSTNSNFSDEGSYNILSVGSCLILPTVIAFCHKVEMTGDNELDYLLNGYRNLISELVSVKKSGIFHQSLLKAACIGAGSLLAFVLNEGVHPVESEWIKDLLELFSKCYSGPYHSAIHLGGMLGVVNAAGAGAGILVHGHYFSYSTRTAYEQKESPYTLCPLLSSPIWESHLTKLMQDIFLVAQNSDDLQMQRNAAWALSFLRNSVWSKEHQIVKDRMNDIPDSRNVSHRFPDDSLVMRLSMQLMDLNYSGVGATAHVCTVLTILRCLAEAPRLPDVDWGSIIRRCMRYESQISETIQSESFPAGTLREESVKFAIAHANQFDVLQTFLDELSDLSRFKTLEPNLQSCLFLRLASLSKVFSSSRLEKLFNDVANFFSSNSSYQMYDCNQRIFLRISCWKGLCQCLDEASFTSLEYISNVEKCMEVLFSFLPLLEYPAIKRAHKETSEEEWCEMIKCLAKAREDWLLNFLQVDLVGDGKCDEVLVKIVTKAKLVRIGVISLTELSQLKAYLLNSKCHGVWNVIVEVAGALHHADRSARRQWLIDAVEISCVSRYPSTSLQLVGLISGTCCKYMPLLMLDRITVLSDLPVTLTSLLTETNWEVITESVVSSLLASTERIYSWVTQTAPQENTTGNQPIDESESDMSSFLLKVMHQTCVSLKDYLPVDKQLKLANMVID